MTGSLLAILGLSLFALGYKVYSKYLVKEIYSIEDEIETPSKAEDGNDYVPTKKHILLIFNGVLLFPVIWLLIEGFIYFIKNKHQNS